MTDQNSIFEPFVSQLHTEGRLRVWSVVISIFGDLVQPRKIPISVRELLALTGQIGIEGNALRTAMSRLAKDGWVVRHKDGRNSSYSLSDTGRDAFLTASERIYHHKLLDHSKNWKIAITPDPITLNREHPKLVLNRNVQILGQNDKADENALIITGNVDVLPEWVRNQLISEALTQHYKCLLQLLISVRTKIDDPKTMEPQTAIVLRFLIIHFWRRLVLRHPLLPKGVVPADWPAIECHDLLLEIYPKLISRSEEWWEHASPNSALKEISARFQ